jgi:polar amino acid transport system substrate-binding protein
MAVQGRGARSAVLVVVAALALSACGGSSSGSGGSSGVAASSGPAAAASIAGDPAHDKLAQVLERGTLVLSTDPAYAPQSMAVEGASRRPDTKCQPTELTADEITGYDAETGKAVAKVLGVEPCFITPQWTEIIAGGWGDRWDIAWGSGAITADRMTRLYVTQPSYSTPAGVFVATDSPYTKLADLSGKRIGACTGCTMEQYLHDTLVLPGVETKRAFDNPQVSTFDNEIPGLEAVASGKIDGFLCSEPVGQGEIDKGLDLRMIEEPAYQSYKTGYVDRESGLSSTAFVAAIDEALATLHADGTLKGLSEKFFGKDYDTAAGAFDMAAINQEVK